MPKRVILVGMFAPFADDAEGVDIWACNRCYETQPNLTRLYCLGPRHLYEQKYEGFVHDVNALGIPVVMQEPHPGIALSEAYPLDDVVARLFGSRDRAYLTSSIAYMLADAILKGYEEIVVHRILANQRSIEYFAQKACLDYLVGVALGLGRTVRVSGDSLIGKPYPWQPNLYGYERQPYGDDPDHILAASVSAIARLPRVA